MIQKYECSETGKWLNYYVRRGTNFYNLHNISYLIGRGSKNPFIYLWRNIPNNHKWTNPDSTGAAKYVTKSGVDFIEKRCKLSSYEKKGFTTVRNLINSIEKLEEMVMETFDMEYVSTLGEDSKLTWGIDNGVPWFCAVDVLSSMGFTKEGSSIKEFEGRTILKQVVPNRTSEGYLFWSEESFKQLRQCFADLCPSKLEYFDNTEAILHLVGLEIKEKSKSVVVKNEPKILRKGYIKNNEGDFDYYHEYEYGNSSIFRLSVLDAPQEIKDKIQVLLEGLGYRYSQNTLVCGSFGRGHRKGATIEFHNKVLKDINDIILKGVDDVDVKEEEVTSVPTQVEPHQPEIVFDLYDDEPEPVVEDIVTVTEEPKERNMLIIYKELIREDGLFSKKQVWVDKTLQVKFEDLEATIRSFGEYKQTIAIFEK
ncbi:hypothetical protein VPHG_00112 [Vibrio phage 11895-B1]|uniref:hypothetical protein n=1 Tax=Vibrio phage 11895-B1 TaxID=754075 RepID=UPI0002C12727|nr:hypothetical protein VPHG_00112 [Vibrio phage 11895-B1]AGH32179.1 hypothetical protein VPHG_00112 [Vibrio phage 11895-B1]